MNYSYFGKNISKIKTVDRSNIIPSGKYLHFQWNELQVKRQN